MCVAEINRLTDRERDKERSKRTLISKLAGIQYCPRVQLYSCTKGRDGGARGQ